MFLDRWYNLYMETIRKLSDIDPRDREVVERVFGQRIADPADVVLILKTVEAVSNDAAGSGDEDEVPKWCHVLEGLSDEDLADFNVILAQPVRLARDS